MSRGDQSKAIRRSRITVHPIRLRGPWEIEAGEAPVPRDRRIDLPALRLPGAGPDSTLRLRRRFSRPPRIDPTTPCRLQLLDVPGLRQVELNGTTLTGETSPALGPDDRLELPIEAHLRPRNTLRLTLTLRDDPGPSGTNRRWGTITLLFDEPSTDRRSGS